VAALLTLQVQMYSSVSNKLLRSISRFKDVAYGAHFRKDGQLLVAGGEAKAVQVFDLSSRVILRTFEGHTKYVLVCASRLFKALLRSCGLRHRRAAAARCDRMACSSVLNDVHTLLRRHPPGLSTTRSSPNLESRHSLAQTTSRFDYGTCRPKRRSAALRATRWVIHGTHAHRAALPPCWPREKRQCARTLDCAARL